MENNNITCQEFIEFLNDYIDDELTQERKSVFENHLSICKNCRSYLHSYKKTIKMTIDSVKSVSFPEEAPVELIDAILAARGR